MKNSIKTFYKKSGFKFWHFIAKYYICSVSSYGDTLFTYYSLIAIELPHQSNKAITNLLIR